MTLERDFEVTADHLIELLDMMEDDGKITIDESIQWMKLIEMMKSNVQQKTPS